jgi:hypothetical protein
MLSNTTGGNNTAVGAQALDSNTTASNNTAVGYASLGVNTTGTQNTAVGTFALDALTVASNCTAVGYIALTSCTGGGNTALGWSAGGSISTGVNNTCLGNNADGNGTTGNGNITIGNNAQKSTATAGGQCTLGDTAITNLRCNDTSISSLSDSRDKTNIVDIPLGLDFINTVRPVSFDWNRRDGSMAGKKDFGFIAQELMLASEATAYADHMRLVHDDNPDKLEADPMKMFPVLVKAVQELSAQNADLITRIEALEG